MSPGALSMADREDIVRKLLRRYRVIPARREDFRQEAHAVIAGAVARCKDDGTRRGAYGYAHRIAHAQMGRWLMAELVPLSGGRDRKANVAARIACRLVDAGAQTSALADAGPHRNANYKLDLALMGAGDSRVASTPEAIVGEADRNLRLKASLRRLARGDGRPGENLTEALLHLLATPDARKARPAFAPARDEGKLREEMRALKERIQLSREVARIWRAA